MAYVAHTSSTFDTLQYAKKLIAVGVPNEQAEVQAEAIKELIDDRLATKEDLKALEIELKRDIKMLEERIALSEERTNERITTMSYKIIISLGGMITAGVVILGFLLKSHG
jgi:hypothetical protein